MEGTLPPTQRNLGNVKTWGHFETEFFYLRVLMRWKIVLNPLFFNFSILKFDIFLISDDLNTTLGIIFSYKLYLALHLSFEMS